MPSFFTAYVQAALFSSTGDDGEPLDAKYTPADIAPDTFVKMKQDCEAFQRENISELRGLDKGQAGHDFWLTDSSKAFGSFDLYIGDDGQINGSPL